MNKVSVVETFRDVSGYELNRLVQDAPSCFNGIVRVRRYKVTVEMIDENNEVIAERIKKLWESNKNHHNWDALIKEGNKYGINLKG